MIRQTALTRLRRHWPILVLVALTLLFFHRLAFTGLILARGDTYNYFYPYWAARNAALMHGQLPLWSPELFMGVPLLANPQLGTFYPPNWLVTPLSPPDGIRLSILLHVFWALLGAYALARRFLPDAIPALAAAVVFGLGGYAGAHVEQINQLQGLAWLPWLLLIYDRALDRPRRFLPLLAIALALQFLSGHAQTTFISAVALGIFAIFAPSPLFPSVHREGKQDDPQRQMKSPLHWWRGDLGVRFFLRALLLLALAGLLALPLIVPQLIPTLELTAVSNRSGGLTLNEATSFSFNPLVIGRGLLPGYDGILFGEYVAYIGVIGLGLALIGAFIPRKSPWSRQRVLWVIVALAGLLLALGEFNPLYPLLLHLPGFSLFRVPARWLALFALGMAMLAGIGLQALMDAGYRLRRWHGAVIVIVTAALATSTLFTPPAEVIGPAVPTPTTWAGWGLALAILAAVYALRSRVGAQRGTALLALALAAELFFASDVQTYNITLPPETYSGQRFTISQLLAYQTEHDPPGRLLSISGLLFDPGDKAALERRYEQFGLSPLATRIGLVATKRKEVVAPNLPLVWGIPSIDGFDGGLLPTRYYTAFSSLLLPPGDAPIVDGRLFEALAQEACRGACLPDQRWLNLTDTRYLVTDKVFDLWHEGVAFDTQLPALLGAGEQITLPNPTGFEANAVDVLYEGSSTPEVAFVSDSGTATLAPEDGFITVDRLGRKRLTLDMAMRPTQVTITANAPTRIFAASLVDRRTGDFAQLTPGPWQRRLSSDIKLYENQAALPRAFVIHDVRSASDSAQGTAAALDLMRQPEFDPARTGVIHTNESASDTQSQAPQGNDEVVIETYTADRIALHVRTDAAGYLLLTDAWYPGWHAVVNDVSTPIARADVMFRAVPVPAGESDVVFAYQPEWLPSVLIAGLIAWVLVIGATIMLWRRGKG